MKIPKRRLVKQAITLLIFPTANNPSVFISACIIHSTFLSFFKNFFKSSLNRTDVKREFSTIRLFFKQRADEHTFILEENDERKLEDSSFRCCFISFGCRKDGMQG